MVLAPGHRAVEREIVGACAAGRQILDQPGQAPVRFLTVSLGDATKRASPGVPARPVRAAPPEPPAGRRQIRAWYSYSVR